MSYPPLIFRATLEVRSSAFDFNNLTEQEEEDLSDIEDAIGGGLGAIATNLKERYPQYQFDIRITT